MAKLSLRTWIRNAAAVSDLRERAQPGRETGPGLCLVALPAGDLQAAMVAYGEWRQQDARLQRMVLRAAEGRRPGGNP